MECAERQSHPASLPVGHGAEEMPRVRWKVLPESVTLSVGTGGAIGWDGTGCLEVSRRREGSAYEDSGFGFQDEAVNGEAQTP